MRVGYVVVAASAACIANSAIVSAAPEDVNNSPKRNLRTQSVLEWPKELEEFVHHHHHIREVFTRWCLEDHEPNDGLKETRGERNPTMEAAYIKVMKAKGLHSRKLAIAECNV
ncbi:hypothetical protein V7S43_006035 [Phytophthora oleae]|uniref:RxLR effector protein n=1 Tax=Phytophthora oleae TaxID=2107226 RepID=A0ABD3FSQ6_9STRA